MTAPPLKLFNTLTRRLDEVRAPDPARPLTLYTCGPTVYDYAHIGNLKTFVVYDFLKRAARYLGHEKVRHVMNLTDIEDKIIGAALAKKQPITAFTAPFAQAFMDDLKAMGCDLEGLQFPRATEFIPQQIALIEKLLASGHAYAREGSVYFKIASFPEYGKLARIDLAGLREGARIDNDEYDKDSPRDFVLWKNAKPDEAAVGAAWESPWGLGRPGWHLECSVMAHDLLGQPIDIHCGGVDLIFPHHTNEIAQSEAAYPEARPFVRNWFHAEHLMVDGTKMSKSLGNFYTWRDLEQKGVAAEALRFFFVSCHYRVSLNFTFEALGASSAGLDRLRTFHQRLCDLVATEADKSEKNKALLVKEFIDAFEDLSRLERLRASFLALLNFEPGGAKNPQELVEMRQAFESALANDLNAPEALARVFEFVTVANQEFDSGLWDFSEAAAILVFFRVDFQSVFGVSTTPVKVHIPAEIQELFNQRQEARLEKDFKRADSLRDKTEYKGWTIEDAKTGARLKPMANKIYTGMNQGKEVYACWFSKKTQQDLLCVTIGSIQINQTPVSTSQTNTVYETRFHDHKLWIATSLIGSSYSALLTQYEDENGNLIKTNLALPALTLSHSSGKGFFTLDLSPAFNLFRITQIFLSE